MRFHDFSESQLKALTWWNENSPYGKMDAIICDGAVRSGKTVCMGLSFFFWSMSCFDGERFGLCGKTVTSLRRNFVAVILPALREMGFLCEERVSKNLLTVSFGGKTNDYYLFGGRDESSAALIQGVTFAGVLLDEVALMPRSFVEQAIARCSVEGSKFWFNCNPESPHHWFYTEWIKCAKEKKALYVHFRLQDNPGLSKEVVDRYARMFSGVFYKRFILGQWVAAQGLVYDFFTPEMAQYPPGGKMASRWVISCDYGTANPCSFGLWGEYGGIWYRVKEYYFDSRREGFQKTDWEYAADLKEFARERAILAVVVDPSAASFIEALRRQGFSVLKANNDVLSGIRTTSSLLKSGKIVISPDCTDALREFSLYCWQDGDAGRDAPKKENDHAMDEIRYFAATVAARESEPFSVAASIWRD